MRVYISLPISGRPIEEARGEAERIKASFLQQGYDVVTPFEIVTDYQGLCGKDLYAYCMGRDIEVLLKCDAIFFAKGHERSKGCQLERMAAIIYGLRIL